MNHLVPNGTDSDKGVKNPLTDTNFDFFQDSSIHTRRLACEILVSMSVDRSNHSSLIQYEGKLADLFSTGGALLHPDIQTKLADCLYHLSKQQ